MLIRIQCVDGWHQEESNNDTPLMSPEPVVCVCV